MIITDPTVWSMEQAQVGLSDLLYNVVQYVLQVNINIFLCVISHEQSRLNDLRTQNK